MYSRPVRCQLSSAQHQNTSYTQLCCQKFVYSIVIACNYTTKYNIMGSAATKEVTISNVQPAEAETMKGWQIEEYGGIESLKYLKNIAVPQIKSPTEVLVEIHTTAINPLDQLMTEGLGSTILNFLRNREKIQALPLILGREFCGIVMDRGTDVRADIQIGDKVWGLVPVHKAGCHAEFVVVDQSTITLKPKNIDDTDAAGVLYAGLTAWNGLFVSGYIGGREGAQTSAGGGKGKRVCILGASGGVGSIAVQMAKAEGMITTATCSTDAVQMVKDLGADEVIDYRKDDVAEKVRDQYFDIILDCSGQGAEYATKLPWKFGQYITFTFPLLMNIDNAGLVCGIMKSGCDLIKNNVQTLYEKRGRVKWGFFDPAPHGIEYFKKLVENGNLRIITDSIYDFESLKDAYVKISEGHIRGKIIVKVKE